MTQDRELETLLSARAFLPPSDDFADRILARSAAMPQRRRVTLRASLQAIFAELIPARPAYAFAALAVLGFFVGMNSNAFDGMTSQAPDQVAYSELFDDGGYL